MSIKSILFGQIDIKARTVNIALLLIRFCAGYTIKTCDINWGDENQSFVGFPIKGSAELDNGTNTKNKRHIFLKQKRSHLFLIPIR